MVHRLQSAPEVVARIVHRATQLRAQAREPVLGERVQQRLAIREMPGRRAMADAHLARELAQRKLLDAPLANDLLGLREQRRAQVAVVVRARSSR